MNVFDLQAIINVDTTAFEAGMAKVAKIGGVAMAAAGAAIVGFGTESVKAGMAFDKSMSQVQATMVKTTEEMASEVGRVDLAWGTFSGNLREYAMEMGKNTAFSATQAADALNYMALAGYDTQTSMEMLPNVLNLAAAGGMDLARASDMVTDTQTAFGISLDRTSQMVDEMAKAASTGNTNVEQLGDAFLTVGGLAQELNGGMVFLSDGTMATTDGVQELEIALTAMANAGIKGSEAGTHMRNMLLKLSSPTDDGTARLEAMGVAVFDTEGKMRSLSGIFEELNDKLSKMTQEEKIQTISDLFNTRDLASAEALLNAMSSDWDEIGESILQAEGSAQKMADIQLDNLAGDITLFKSALEGAEITISDQLTPTLRNFVQLGTTGIQDIVDAFKNDGLSSAAEKFGDIVSDGVTIMIEKLPLVVEAGGQILSGLMKGITENASAIADGVASLAVSIVTFFSENIGTFISGAITIAGEVGSALIENLPTILVAVGEGIVDGLYEVTQGIPEMFLGIVESIWDLFGDFDGMSDSYLEETDLILKASKGVIDSWDKVKESKDKTIENADREYSYYQGLVKELQGLRTENGKVRDSDKARADFIIGELSKATDTEIQGIDDVIDKHGELQSAIAETLEQKRAQAIVDAEESAYKEALEQRYEVEKQMVDVSKQMQEGQKAYTDALNSGEATMVHANYLQTMGYEGAQKQVEAWALQKSGLGELQEQYGELESTLDETYQAIGQYESDYAKLNEGNYAEVGQHVKDYSRTTSENLQGTIDELKRTIEAEKINLEAAKRNVEESGIGESYVKQSEEALEGYQKDLATLEQRQKEFLLGTIKNNEGVVSEIKTMAGESYKVVDYAGEKFGGGGGKWMTSTAAGVSNNAHVVIGATNVAVSNAVVAASSHTGEMENVGSQLMAGLRRGIESVGNTLASLMHSKVSDVVKEAEKAGLIKSPSRRMMYVGEMLMKGLGEGIEDFASVPIDAMSEVADDVLDEMDGYNDAMYDGFESSATDVTTIQAEDNPQINDILTRLESLENNLYTILVDAISDGVELRWNERELGRMVRTYA